MFREYAHLNDACQGLKLPSPGRGPGERYAQGSLIGFWRIRLRLDLRQLLALHGKYGLRFGSRPDDDFADDHCGTLRCQAAALLAQAKQVLARIDDEYLPRSFQVMARSL
jgi:hypothetical protein